MITVANRATPKPKTQKQLEDAMTSEGAPPEGQMPEPAPTKPTASTSRPTLHLPADPHGEHGASKA